MPSPNLYLNNMPLDEALDLYLRRLRPLVAPRTVTVPVETALGRVSATPSFARLSSPSYTAAAMDGIAVQAARTTGASEVRPLRLLAGSDYRMVDTGDPVTAPFDAVIMAEDVIEVSDGVVEIIAAAAPWMNVRPIGEDFSQAEMVLPSHHRIRPMDIGLLLSGGITEFEVFDKPSVAIIPTGGELLEPELASAAGPASGKIIESNSRMIAAMVDERGGAARRLPITADDFQTLTSAIRQATDRYDIVLVIAGSSAGTEDYTAPILRELGELLVHGVAVKPGKPVILAVVDGKPVIGLPGYPLAAYFSFENFVGPVMGLFSGMPRPVHAKADVVLAKRIVSSLKFQEYVQVRVGSVDDRMVAAPLSRGSGVLSSLVRADGFLTIDQNAEGLEAGSSVEVNLYRGISEVKQTVLAIGSHDLALDIIADLMMLLHPGSYLSSTHVGSLAGLNALRRGDAHLAPCHLLDSLSGSYNVPAIRELFGNQPMALIKGLRRIQGLIVAQDNPHGIDSIKDLTRPGLRYINRQRGAGTRVLLDYWLQCEGISSAKILGYEREAVTHIAVASAVAADSADAGLGIKSAANALGLNFVELGHEEYDFAIPQRFLGLEPIRDFIETLRSPELRSQLEALGGYGFERCGEVVML